MGAQAGRTREDEAIALFVASMHDTLMLFTNRGRVYAQKVHELPEASRSARGTHLAALLPLAEGEEVATLLNLRSLEDPGYLVFATRRGLIKRTAIREYQNLSSAGLIALNLLEEDSLIGVALAQEEDQAVLATQEGKALRFALKEVRSTGRASQGVTGIRLRPGDQVVSLVILPGGQEAELLAVSSRGYGKRTASADYPIHARGGQGVYTFRVTPKVGTLAALLRVQGPEDLLVLSRKGLALRTSVESIRLCGRSTSGVKIIQLSEEDEIAAAFVVQPQD